jgi:NADH-quinone oxidoreductase subunit H
MDIVPSTLNSTIWTLGLLLAMGVMLLTMVPVMVMVERRGSAWLQRRVGPNRVGPFGLLQPAADAIKLIFKEANIPIKAHKTLFVLAPGLAVIPPILAFMAIPLAGSLHWNGGEYAAQILDIEVSLLFILAISSLHVYSVLAAGWSSNNKFSLMGALRSSSQMISYEIAIGVVIASMIFTYGTLDLREIVKLQESGSGLPAWGAALQPVAFIILWVSAFAETNRLPFDLPEGESELVAGYHTEYSGLTFGLFMLGEYVAMFVSSAFLATVFLGGYNVPFISEEGLRQFFIGQGTGLDFASVLTLVCQFSALMVKTLFFMWVFVWVRWTLPRFRYDQLMDLGWKTLLPIGVLNVVITMIVTYILAQ